MARSFLIALCFWRGSKEGSRPLPTNNRMTSGYWQSTHFRQVCRGRIHASRAVYPLGCVSGTAATGGIYAAPTEYPLCSLYYTVAGGACPAPTLPIYIVSFRDIRRGRIYASRAVCPLGCIVGTAATGGIYAAPTEYPLCSLYHAVAGGACPAPTNQPVISIIISPTLTYYNKRFPHGPTRISY